MEQYDLAGIDLAGTTYTIEQTGRDKNLRPEYEARDVAGDTIFRGKYEMYQEKDEFPFVDTDGTEIFTVKASGTWDIAGDYLLTDSQTGEDIVVLDNDVSVFRDTWRIRDADDQSVLAEITSRGALVTVARKLLPLGQWIAHEYEVTDSAGESVGSIEGEFALFDQYEITITDVGSVPAEPIVIGTIIVDAIQGN
jgi:uncharacterized protein YxjI